MLSTSDNRLSAAWARRQALERLGLLLAGGSVRGHCVVLTALLCVVQAAAGSSGGGHREAPGHLDQAGHRQPGRHADPAVRPLMQLDTISNSFRPLADGMECRF